MLNIMIVDEQGNTRRETANTPREALDFIESEQSARNGRGPRHLPLVAAFIFDGDNVLLHHYIIDGLRAVLVTLEMFT